MTPRWKKKLDTIILLAMLLALTGGVVAFQHRQFSEQGPRSFVEEKLYLPDSEKLRMVSMGFRHLYADLLWLRAIQSFGSRWYSGGDVSLIFHYFDVITDLDPHFIEAYKLGNLIIGDEGSDYDRALALLRKGMFNNPMDWELPFLGIYNSIWDIDDMDQARWFAVMADRRPHRPEFVARMREYIERKTGRYDVAFRMNLQYLLRYLDQGNQIEAKITSIRFWDILDRWYLSEMIASARRFIAMNGRDPDNLEELAASPAWFPLYAPTMETLRDAINDYRQRGKLLQPHYDAIVEQTFTTIPGVPREPNGFYYVLLESDQRPEPTTPVASEMAFDLPDRHFSYIINAERYIRHINEFLMSLEMELRRYWNENARWPENLEQILGEEFENADALGGRFLYDPQTGEVRNTTLEQGRRHERVYIE